MPGRMLPFPLSKKNLRKFSGLDSPLYEFLEYAAVRDVSFQTYDFNVKALDTTNIWTVAAGTGATTWAVRAEAGGWLRGVTGTTAATSGLQLQIPQKYWTGTSAAGMACLFRLSSATEIRIEVGFADAIPAVNTTLVNSLVTPTFNTATAAALYVYDQTGTAATSGLYTAGTSATSAVNAITGVAPTATTPFFVAVQAVGNTVWCYAGDRAYPVARTSGANFVGTDGLTLIVSVKGSATASVNVDIDKIMHWSNSLG